MKFRMKASARRNIGIFATVGLIALASIQVSGCAVLPAQKALGAEANVPEPAVSVRIGEVVKGRIVATLTYTGDVKPKNQVVVSAKTMGRIEDLSVDIGSRVRAGDVIGRLERTSLEAQGRQAEAAVEMADARLEQIEAGARAETIAQAQANLDSARARLASIEDGGRAEVVAQSEAALRLSESRLAQLMAGPTHEQIEQAEGAIRAAKNQVYAVQAQADSLMGRIGTGFTQDMKEAQSGAAYEQVNIAEARLAELRAGATKEQAAQAQAAVDQARAALELARNPFTAYDLRQGRAAVVAAEEQLKLAQSPFTAAELKVAKAPIAQAQASADLVKAQLADADLVAPIDGIVSERHLSMGALASPQAPVVTIISNEMEITLPIEETRAGQVAAGQAVSVTVAAYPNRSFDATITSVAPSIDPRSRSFMVRVAVDDGGKLKAGMLAKVGVGLDEREGVTLVPEPAVLKRGSENSVFVVADGRARVRKIEIGASDGSNVEVRSGLQVGDKVVYGAVALKDGDAVSWE